MSPFQKVVVGRKEERKGEISSGTDLLNRKESELSSETNGQKITKKQMKVLVFLVCSLPSNKIGLDKRRAELFSIMPHLFEVATITILLLLFKAFKRCVVLI